MKLNTQLFDHFDKIIDESVQMDNVTKLEILLDIITHYQGKEF